MKSIISWAVRNSPAMNTVMIGLLFVGAVSLGTMRREVFPQFELEIILVSVPYPGASPEEVEQGICQKIEEAVRSIAGIKKQTSVAQEGSGFLVLELETYVDVQKTLNEIRSQIDRIPSFPELAEDAEVEQLTFRDPAIRVGVIGPRGTDLESELALREVTEDIRSEILRLKSVSQANIIGSRDYQIDVEIPEDRLRKYGLSLSQVANIIRRENVELPGGSMKTDSQEILLRGKNKQLVGEGIAKIPLVTQQDGLVLTVDDLGHVRDAFVDISAKNFIDGQPGLVVSVDRTRNEDLLRIVDEVKTFVAEHQMPAGYSLKTWADKSIDVRDRMNLLVKNGLQGLLLVFIVLAIFLDLRLSFWVAMGIPIAVLGAGVVLLYSGQTLNMLSMFAFLMALGIVVDDAIVIGENIYAHRQMGETGMTAAINGTMEVFPSVAASVTTTIIAFMPLFFVSGVMGKFIAVMPLAVIAMLVISLLESCSILPCHLAHSGQDNFVIRWFSRYANLPFMGLMLISLFCVTVAVILMMKLQAGIEDFRISLVMVLGVICLVLFALAPAIYQLAGMFRWLNVRSNRFLDWVVEKFYLPALNWCIENWLMTVCCALCLMLGSFGLVEAGVTPWIVFPKTDSNEIQAFVTFPDGTPATVTDKATKQILDAIDRVNDRFVEQGGAVIKTRRRAVGTIRDQTAIGPESRVDGSHRGQVDAELVESGVRTVRSQKIIDAWRDETGEVVGAEDVRFGSPEMGPGGAAIEFKILARKEHMGELEGAIEMCKEKLREYAGVVDIRDDSRPGKWEYQLKIKEKAKSLGITLADLSQTIRASYFGEEVMRLQRGRHEVKLMVRYPPAERSSDASFEEIRVRALDGREYPLTELAEVTTKRGYSEINRVDQLRSITITADVREQEGNARATVADLQANYEEEVRAAFPNVQFRWEGQQEQTSESVASLLFGFAVAIISMFVLLTVEFRSYFQPLIILAIIPFGVVGAIWGHFAIGLPITIFTLFGLVALTGVVVNDSIVLIDFINLRTRSGDSTVRSSLLEAGRRRFRPVLLTSFTTIAGLTPMLTETSFQAQFLIPLAATMVFGLLVATGLVLILIPTLYSIYQRYIIGSALDEISHLANESHEHHPAAPANVGPLQPASPH